MQCSYTDKSGNRCKAKSLKEENCCFWHSENPEVIQLRNNASKNGGKASKKFSLNTKKWKYKNSQSLVILLEDCINKTISGKLPPKVANTLTYLVNSLVSVVKQNDFEKRMEVIENAIKISK